MNGDVDRDRPAAPGTRRSIHALLNEWVAIGLAIAWAAALLGVCAVADLGFLGAAGIGAGWLLVASPFVGVAAIWALCVRRQRLWVRRWGGSGFQCPQCEYDLTANKSGRCPECGSPTVAPPDDQAIRRRAWQFEVGCLTCGSIAAVLACWVLPVVWAHGLSATAAALLVIAVWLGGYVLGRVAFRRRLALASRRERPIR